jgi:alkyl hydroperoxide reductase subunit D
MEFINTIKNSIPDYAKDIRLNLDSIIAKSSLDKNLVLGIALSCAFAAKNAELVQKIQTSGEIDATYINAALTAASLMAMNNTWYPYVEIANDTELKSMPAGLRMNAYSTHGDIDKNHFEMFALAASIVGKCPFCVESHYNILKKNGISINELKEIGKIAAVIVAVSHILQVQ